MQVSADGKNFTTVAEKQVPVPASEGASPFTVSWPETEARYVRVIAEPLGIIPAGNTGAGDEAWLFIDELVLN